MNTAIITDEKVWFICHNGVDRICYGMVDSCGGRICTECPIVCVYSDKTEYDARLSWLAQELGVEPEPSV